MKIEDKFVIAAPLEQAWDLLLDIPRVSQCMPGVQAIEQIDDTTYKGKLIVKVGPIRANFDGQVELAEVEPPQRLSAKARARDQASASMASIDFSATLTPTDAGATEVAFDVDVAIRGRLGQFGQGVIRETAKQMTQLFAECIQGQLSPQATEQQTSTANDTQSDGTQSTQIASDPVPSASAKTPSLLVILVKSILNTLVNWLRSLRPTS